MLAKVAGEEIDHFRKINRLLNELGEDASELMYIEKSRRDLEAFRQAMPTWADVAVFGFLIDRVGQYQLEEFVGCSYAPLDRALPKIIQEEKTHVGYGLVKLRDMVRTEEGRAEAQAALDRWCPRGLDMFGPANSRRAARYQHWGLQRTSSGSFTARSTRRGPRSRRWCTPTPRRSCRSPSRRPRCDPSCTWRASSAPASPCGTSGTASVTRISWW